MSAAQYRYHAKPIKQKLRLNGVLIGCTDTAFAMLVDAATLGGVVVTEAQVRGLSTEAKPDPISPGLNLQQLEGVAARLRIDFESMKGQSWDTLEAGLRQNRRVVAQLWYADIGGGNIGHAVYLEQLRGDKARIVDPIKGAYEFIATARLKAGMKEFALRNGLTTGLYWGRSRPTPWLSLNQKPLPPK